MTAMNQKMLTALIAKIVKENPAILAAALAQVQQPKAAKPRSNGKLALASKAEVYQPKPKASGWDVEAAAIKAAEKAGFPGAKPRIDLLAASLWLKKGFVPKKGTEAIYVKKPGSAGKGMPLFHVSQVQPVKG